MKAIMLLAAVAAFSAGTAAAQGAASAKEPRKGEVAVGEIYQVELPCNPTTGNAWELKSIDRSVAVSTGTAEFQASPAAPGAVGSGGNCVLRLLGVKPGKTKAVFVYRRSWEKGAPARTAAVELKVLPKKNP